MKHLFKAALVAANSSTPGSSVCGMGIRGRRRDRQRSLWRRKVFHRWFPHDIEKTKDKHCLECHEKGKYGAPMTPHPERKYCVQCHGQGEITVDLDKIKKQYKKKKKMSLSRKEFLTQGVFSLGNMLLPIQQPRERTEARRLIRPPGLVPEKDG